MLSAKSHVSNAAGLASLYAHPTVEDAHGVIAPWHPGLNGQLDERLTLAANVYKRYPWVTTDRAVMAAPDFVYNSHWSIQPDGTIVIPPTTDWMCGDLSQRAWSIIKGLTAYYQYSGDPIAFVYIPLTADYILDYAQTPEDDPAWPRFPISTPTLGKAYGRCDPRGRNQLDLCAVIGTEILRAHKLTGNLRYLEAARHWGDLFAAHCNFDPEESPWDRYVDPSVVGWSDVLTGSTAMIANFLDELIEIGHRDRDDLIVRARDRARQFLRDQMLPRWLVNETWGRSYWDWDNPIMCGTVSMICDYFQRARADFPNWRADVRNIMLLIANRNSADPVSMADTYSGAWAWPESSVCCGTSLSYNQYTAAPTIIRYGALADDPWAREIGRRMILMATYDSETNGVVKDGLLGQTVATGEWSNLAHPWPLCQALEAMAWMPRALAPNRENHILRCASVVQAVRYEKGRVSYRTYDASPPAVDALRLAFEPEEIRGNRQPLLRRANLDANGYTVEALSNGDWLVHIRHDGQRTIAVEGPDPQTSLPIHQCQWDGAWTDEPVESDDAAVDLETALRGGSPADPSEPPSARIASAEGASMTVSFHGNQVRVIGAVDTDGGWADAYLDGVKQLTRIECWNPQRRERQLLFARGGLNNRPHELKLVARGQKNPLSRGTAIRIAGVQCSDATGDAGYGSGGGPTGPQRMIFGYPKREDYIDSAGQAWRTATEFVIRLGAGQDTVARCWWTARRTKWVGNTRDPELYRYGVRGREFRVALTVGPGRYRLTLKWADTAETPWMERENGWNRVVRLTSVWINGEQVIDRLDAAKEANGPFRAVDRTFDQIAPRHGIIEVRFQGADGREAMIQALELVPMNE